MIKTLDNILMGMVLASATIWTLEKNLGVENPYIAGNFAAISVAAYIPLAIYNDYKRKKK